MSRLLIVEDESHIGSGLRYNLEADGHDVTLKDNGEAALAELEADPSRVDLVVLDVMLPGINGFTVASRMRARGWLTPILMLTARGRAEDVLRGFEAGADDYLPKPFEPRELLARLRAILRRKSSAAAPQDVKRFGRLEIDRAGRRVTIDGEECPLTSYQFALLDALAGNAGRVMSRDALMDLTKGEQLEAFDRSVDVHISRIRAAIEDDAKKPRRIITIRGAGYVFAKEQDRA
jgi:DNA-binding response OmpR family regulator